MDFAKMKLVRPLGGTHEGNTFLEALLTEFDLARDGDGANLTVLLDDNVPTIWSNGGKKAVQDAMPDFDRKKDQYQQALDEILLRGGQTPFKHRDPDFPFRYVSGGTLPIINFGDKHYYCMFYRELAPAIGWNIANGGSDSLEELLDPFGVVERELREEILAFDLEKRKLFELGFSGAKAFNRPEYRAAEAFWQEQSGKLDLPPFSEMREEVLDIEWIDGPDSLTVKPSGHEAQQRGDLFLNINALDFGIEVDRICIIDLYDGASICDGEFGPKGMINAPVGLFEVEKTNSAAVNGADAFLPDLLFSTGQPRDPDDVEAVISNEFVPRMQEMFPDWDSSTWRTSNVKYDLCPVTRNIILRYTQVLQKNSVG